MKSIEVTNLLSNVCGWLGEFKLDFHNTETDEVTEYRKRNRITNTALDAIINILDNIDPNLNIKYVAIGTSSTAINDNDTQLGNEIFRAQLDTSNNTAVGEFTTTFSILDNEAIGQWEEIGIFCGDSATAAANSGLMLSRILFSRNKTSLEEVDISRIDKVVRA